MQCHRDTTNGSLSQRTTLGTTNAACSPATALSRSYSSTLNPVYLPDTHTYADQLRTILAK